MESTILTHEILEKLITLFYGICGLLKSCFDFLGGTGSVLFKFGLALCFGRLLVGKLILSVYTGFITVIKLFSFFTIKLHFQIPPFEKNFFFECSYPPNGGER